jgi:hypothetical protein
MPIGVTLRIICGRFSATETWYSRNAGTVADGVTAGFTLAKRRADPLASNCYIEGYRVFNSDVQYDVRNVTLAAPAAGGELGIVGQLPKTGPGLADIQSTSLLAKATGNVGGRARTGNRELFGVPDNVVQTTALGQRVYVPTAAFTEGLISLQAELTTSWNFRVLTIAVRHPIQQLVVDAAPPSYLGLRVDLQGDATIVPAKRCRIRGAVRQTTMFKLNGLWSVSRIDPPVAPSTLSTVYLLHSAGSDPYGYDPLGTVEGISYTYCPTSQYQVIRPMGRKRGGRSGLPLGRSRARAV